MEEIRLFIKSGIIHKVTLPVGCSVSVKDYDIHKYDKNSLEPDEKNNLCRWTIYKRGKIVHEITVIVKNNIPKIRTCPNSINVTMVNETVEETKKKK